MIGRMDVPPAGDEAPQKRPEIDYPGPWDYQIIGEDEQRVRIAVAGIVGNVEYMLSRANISKKGRYVSLLLTVVVKDEAERLSIFHALRQHADVRYVL